MDNPSLPGFQSACCILEKRMLVGKSHPFLSTPEASGWGGEGWNLPCGLQPELCSQLQLKQDPGWARQSVHDGKNKSCSLELQPANLEMHHVSQMWYVFHATHGALFTCVNYLRMPFVLYAHWPFYGQRGGEIGSTLFTSVEPIYWDFLSIHLHFITCGCLPQICDKHRSSSSLQFSLFNGK